MGLILCLPPAKKTLGKHIYDMLILSKAAKRDDSHSCMALPLLLGGLVFFSLILIFLFDFDFYSLFDEKSSSLVN
jgi:hypothetical protein